MLEPIKPQTHRLVYAVATIALISTILGSLFALLILFNRVFGVRELVDTGAVDVSTVLSDLDEKAGIPTAVSPPTPLPNTTLTPVAPTGSYNLILAGNDYRPGRLPACDTCFLIHTDVFVYVNIVLDQPSRVTMVSLPRELYLHVDGIVPDSRINQLYARGGIEWIELWSENILGVEIDGVAVVQMDVFERIVDEIGGINLTAPETFTDQCGSDFYTYEEGVEYHLDGLDALCYARMRYYNPRGYFARQERHMDIIEALFEAVIDDFSDDPLVTAVKMVSLYYDEVETTMSPELVAKIVSDVVLTYYFAEDMPEIRMFSIDRTRLELYPRVDDDAPVLWRTTFVIRDWLQCVLQDEIGDCK